MEKGPERTKRTHTHTHTYMQGCAGGLKSIPFLVIFCQEELEEEEQVII